MVPTNMYHAHNVINFEIMLEIFVRFINAVFVVCLIAMNEQLLLYVSKHGYTLYLYDCF